MKTLQQDEVNRRVYYARGVYRYYLSQQLTPAETACFSKYQRYLSGRDVLDVGVGAGRTTRYLAPKARRYEAVDYSPVMVDYLKNSMPDVSVRQADFRDLRAFGNGEFDFVLATDNVIDALSHEDRLKALRESSRILRPGGILAFSSHNIRYARAFTGPQLDWSANPMRFGKHLARYLLSWKNHLRVAPLRVTTPEYALLNDRGHFYACLHYYAARPTVALQLARCGLRLLDVFDLAGNVLSETGDDTGNASLMYMAQREGSPPPHLAN